MTARNLHDFKWTKRNEDKPHRCPHCHAIAARAWLYAEQGRGHGPRTIYGCGCCGLKWRVGNRVKGFNMRDRQLLLARDYSSCECCR